MIDREWIQEKCFTKTGKFNNRVVIESWWYNRNCTTQLKELQALMSERNYSSLTETLYCIYHERGQGTCKTCSKLTTFYNFKSGYAKYCSLECSYRCTERNEKISKNTDQIAKQEAMKATNVKRYGVERPSKLFAYKAAETKFKRYGDSKYNNKEKSRETCLARYGVEWASLIPEKIAKTIHACDEKNPLLRDKEWLIEQNKTKSFYEIGSSLGVSEFAVGYWFKKHNITAINHSNNYVTKPQYMIAEYIKSLGFNDIIVNDTNTIKPKHIDILIPSKGVGVELNGLFWHSDFYVNTYNPKKHLEKYNICKANNIRCIQFWSSEWNQKTEICKSIISSALGVNKKIYARNTVLREVPSSEYVKFMNENHLHGAAPASIRYGLYVDGQLIQCVGFGKSRYNNKYDYELIRSATKKFYNVVGGLSKLMKRAPKGKIVSYCNRMVYDGTGYERVGFKRVGESKPNYFYFQPSKENLHSRLQFQKHKLQDLLEVFDPNLPETLNMRANGWFRVHDCGNSIWFLDNRN